MNESRDLAKQMSYNATCLFHPCFVTLFQLRIQLFIQLFYSLNNSFKGPDIMCCLITCPTLKYNAQPQINYLLVNYRLKLNRWDEKSTYVFQTKLNQFI